MIGLLCAEHEFPLNSKNINIYCCIFAHIRIVLAQFQTVPARCPAVALTFGIFETLVITD